MTMILLLCAYAHSTHDPPVDHTVNHKDQPVDADNTPQLVIPFMSNDHPAAQRRLEGAVLCEEVNAPEDSRTYSSVWEDEVIGTGHARSTLNSDQAWSAKTNEAGQWLQIDLGEVGSVGSEYAGVVAGVVTQGRRSEIHDQWVTLYEVQHSLNGNDFTSVGDFDGNSDKDAQVSHTFPAVQARYIRFLVKAWSGHVSMRAGVLGGSCGKTGCQCFDGGPDGVTGEEDLAACACCAVGACQCGGIARDTCAMCSDTQTCPAVVRQKQLADPTAVDDDILTSTGCPCFFDNSPDGCACCKPGRCQCSASAATYNFAIVVLKDKCVSCYSDCNERWIDRSLDGKWVVEYPEPNEGLYGEMVWEVSGFGPSGLRAFGPSGLRALTVTDVTGTLKAHYLSGELPGMNDTRYETGVHVAKVGTIPNTYTVTRLHCYHVRAPNAAIPCVADVNDNVPSETVTVSPDGLSLTVVAGPDTPTTCKFNTPGVNCLVEGHGGDGSYILTEDGTWGSPKRLNCPCWWDSTDTACACCSAGGCGCGAWDDRDTDKAENATHIKVQCVPCKKWWRCDPQPLPVTHDDGEVRTTYRCSGAQGCNDDANSAHDQPRTDTASYKNYTISRTGCPTVNSSDIGMRASDGNGLNGACCSKGGCPCGIAPLYYVSPNLCVPCDATSDRCKSENVIATWKVGEWDNCTQPCAGSDKKWNETHPRIVGTQVRYAVCSDQWYNNRTARGDLYDCEAETRIDYYAGSNDTAQFPTKDVTDKNFLNEEYERGGYTYAGTAKHWRGGPQPHLRQFCNDVPCDDYTCYKTATQRLVSIGPDQAYDEAVYASITPGADAWETRDEACSSFHAECYFDTTRSDCARCLPGGCQCDYAPVKHLCVSCDDGGGACVGSIPHGDSFFSWAYGGGGTGAADAGWSSCDEACTFEGNTGTQHRVVTCKGADGGAYADRRCGGAVPARRKDCQGGPPCKDAHTLKWDACPCWFNLNERRCGCCRPAGGKAGCQITTPENGTLLGCNTCQGAVERTSPPTPAPTPTPTAAPTPRPAKLREGGIDFIGFGPGLLSPGSWHKGPDDKCLDYNYHSGNVYMHSCHTESNQVFRIDPATKAIMTSYDDKCLDYNSDSGNVYMHSCHNGLNQQWYFDPYSGALKSKYDDDKCMDYNAEDVNVGMAECDHAKNQSWHFVTRGVRFGAHTQCSQESYACADQSAALTQCRSEYGAGAELCESDEIRARVGPVCALMWTASSSTAGYYWGTDTTGCGTAAEVNSATSSYEGNGMFDAACCWVGGGASEPPLDESAGDPAAPDPEDGCQDTDNGAGDVDGDPCSHYRASWCGGYNDDDFESNVMCCICGGGTTRSCQDTDNGAGDVDDDPCSRYRASWCGGYDDDDFESNVMCCICGGGAEVGGRRLEQETHEIRRLQEDSPQCMMCVSGVAPELANCNPGNAARYLGHAECCNVWAGALDLCTAHCPVSAKTRRLAACDTLIIGDKDVDKCDACLELQQAGSSTGSDCQAWKKLVSQCAGPCEEGHKNYASCVVVEAEEEKSLASPEACRRCVFSRSPDVADCLPNNQGKVFGTGCCKSWSSWLGQCEAACPAPQVADEASCDLEAVVDANLVQARDGWAPAATCEECVSRLTGGQACLNAPTKQCCDNWETSWAATCRFQCGSEGLEHTQTRLCVAGSGGEEFSAAPVVALLSFLA